MTRNTLKLMACAAILALGTTSANIASAQETVTLNATLITSSAITLTSTADADFGTWLLLDGTTDSTLLMSPVDGTVTDSAGTGATVVEITAGASRGEVTLNTPAAASVDFWGSVTTDFTDAGLGLGTLTYSLNSGTSTTLPTATGTAITTTGGTDDTIGIGGTVTMTDTPTDATHTAVVTINAEY